MHLAPAVHFTVKRSRWQARLMACLGLAALITLAVFVWDQAAVDVRPGILAFSILLAVGTAYLGWRRSPQGSLRWDGQHWYWSGFAKEAVCRLDLMMDFQSVMLVRIKAEAQAPAFLWLEATPDATNWKSLRRAIVSSQAAASGGKNKNARLGAEGDLA